VTTNHRNFTIERPLNIGDAKRDSEITELEQHLLELKQYILKWSKQDIPKSHKDSDEERHVLYTSAKSNRVVYLNRKYDNMGVSQTCPRGSRKGLRFRVRWSSRAGLSRRHHRNARGDEQSKHVLRKRTCP
jgi:hypothetical protein